MNKFFRIIRKSVSTYYLYPPSITRNVIYRKCILNSATQLEKTSIFKINPRSLKIPTDIAIALSLLTWLGFTQEDENKESELIMTLKRAVLCKQREQFEKAEQILHLALRLAQQQQNEQGILYCYDLMANLAFDQHELDKAQKLFVSVLQMLLSKGMKQENLEVIHISLKLARICQLKADIEKAEVGYKWCLEQIEKQKNDSTDANLLYGIINDWYAQFLLDKGDVSSSLKFLREAHKVCSETEGKEEQVVLLLNDLGITSFRAEEIDNAEKYLKEAISVGKNLDDKSHLGVVHANLGLILLHKGVLLEAEKSCKEAWHLGINQKAISFVDCTQVNVNSQKVTGVKLATSTDIPQEKSRKHENSESIEQANYCFDQIKLNLGK